jgi:hypothetical protein
MWNLKCKITPVIIGATEIVTKGLMKNVEAIPYHKFNKFTTKKAVLGTSHITWKLLQCETLSLSGGDHLRFKRITRE